MVSGMVCLIRFSSVEAENRFLKWVVRGNERNEAMGLNSLGLKARIHKLKRFEYLFMWEHVWVLSMGAFLRFMLWMQMRKVRRFVKISSVRKLELADLVLSRGLKDGEEDE